VSPSLRPVVTDTGFLAVPPSSPEAERLYADDLASMGYVNNLTRAWAYLPAAHDRLFDLLRQAVEAGGLTLRQRGILVGATASTLGDAYCSLAWGTKLAGEAGPDLAGCVLRGDDGPLDPAERALARWARAVTRDPNGTGPEDIDALREAGLDDRQIFAVTLFVALRIAFSTVNDALGARPDRELAAAAPPPVRDAVRYGRPAASET
jgi:alkylhydroperoxidase family enzyme